MDIYHLTPKGMVLAHNYKGSDKPAWRVIYYLRKMGDRTKEQILSDNPGVSSMTISYLNHKNVIASDTRVMNGNF
jgi:hypothetical protein